MTDRSPPLHDRFPTDPHLRTRDPAADLSSIGHFPEDPVLRRALGYPYQIPTRSFVLAQDGPRPMSDDDWSGLAERWPVIACGSNQAVDQLTRKFSGRLDRPLPVVKARLADHDSVYSAHITTYGSLAATLCESPGTHVELAVTFLDDRQLDIMHSTEAVGVNYDFAVLQDIDLRLENGQVVTTAHGYNSRWGALGHNGGPVPLTEVAADGRRYPARDQMAVQTLARDRLAPDMTLKDFILENISDAQLRQGRTRRLAADAVDPFRRDAPSTADPETR